RVSGPRGPDFLCRLRGTGVVARAAESRRGRPARAAVQLIGMPGAAGAGAAETLLVVERVYAPHLLGWIRETLADLDCIPPPGGSSVRCTACRQPASSAARRFASIRGVKTAAACHWPAS